MDFGVLISVKYRIWFQKINNMKNKYFLLTIIAILASLFSYLFVLKNNVEKHQINDPVANMIMNWRKPLKIHKIKVLSGHEYDLTVEDGRRIKASLSVFSTPESKEKMIQFLNRASNPKVILDREEGNIWYASIYVTVQNSIGQEVEIDLARWLKEKNLVYIGSANVGK
jgi:hypothetical protein